MVVSNISAEEFFKKYEKNPDEWEIIDVRETFEWEEGHIKSSKLIPMNEIAGKEDEIDWKKKVLIYCRSGNRSFQVAGYLSSGDRKIWNLEGGILEIDKNSKYLTK